VSLKESTSIPGDLETQHPAQSSLEQGQWSRNEAHHLQIPYFAQVSGGMAWHLELGPGGDLLECKKLK
jgi:hypothetical protein